MYLSNGGEPNPDGNGGGSPSYFVTRRRLMINAVNIKICIYYNKEKISKSML
jgi:site-specific DNA recombinase